MNKSLNIDVLFISQYGSRLYGTSTPKSDTDLKSVYLPAIDDMLLGKKLSIFKVREDALGKPVPEGDSMPDGGVENEFFPIQTFVRDFVAGQTYALEMAYAILLDGPTSIDDVSKFEYEFVKELVELFGNAEIGSMSGFAQKAVFDYVHRGERLNEARAMLTAIMKVLFDMRVEFNPKVKARLDSISRGKVILDVIASSTGLPIGSVANNGKTLRTLELNGRSYPESTTLEHLVTQLQKLIEKYGDRSTKASETDVDFKSLSHAVRVYQQAIELLDTGKITFPRPNAAKLLRIKSGEANLEEVKALLLSLDEEVLRKIESSTVRRKTPELVQAAESWLVSKLRVLYCLE